MQKTLFTLLLILVIAFGLWAGNTIDKQLQTDGNPPPIHKCDWEDCDMAQGFTSDYEPGTDGYCLDTLHFQWPDRTYEQIESSIMGVDIAEYEKH